jgi:hypothetical protein
MSETNTIGYIGSRRPYPFVGLLDLVFSELYAAALVSSRQDGSGRLIRKSLDPVQ